MREVVFRSISEEDLRTIIREELSQITKYDQAPKKEIYTISDLADVLSVSKVTIHKWKKEGKISFYRIEGRVYFRKEDVFNALKKGGEL